jgi:hypothetical protein
MERIIELAMIVSQIPVCLVPFYYIVYKGVSFKKGVLLVWVLWVLWAVILSMPFYELVWLFSPELTENIPEGNSIVATFCFGWFPGIIVSLIAITVRDYRNKRKCISSE